MITAIYPGTFDPVTYGHLDILKRACQLFDKVILAVAENNSKNPLFSAQTRVALVQELIQENNKDFSNAQALSFNQLTVDFARKHNASVIIRGLRAISDFEYEFQIAQMNRHLDKEVETVFLMPKQEFFYTSSQLIKNVSYYSIDRISRFVPNNVLEALKKHFGHQ